jgi:thymidylate synthase ThyX
VARFVLPQGGYTRMFVSSTCRNWMHYLGVRDEPGVVQWEHVELARAIKPIFATEFPTVNKAYFHRDPDPRDAEIAELQSEIQVLKAIQRGKL